jgi:hypothetical protein
VKITSEYIEPNDPQNPGIEYGHVRLVKWAIIDGIENLSYNFPQKTITPIGDDRKWDEIKTKYIQKDEKYEDIFAKLASGGEMNLSELVSRFVSELDEGELKRRRSELNNRSENVRTKLVSENIETLTQEDILNILKNTDATYYGSLGSIQFDRIITDNGGIDQLKRKLVELLEATDLNENAVKELIGSFKYLGHAYLSELLCLKQPEKFWIWNSFTDKFFSKMNINIEVYCHAAPYVQDSTGSEDQWFE